jgi:carboxyl-terminal processing protease
MAVSFLFEVFFSFLAIRSLPNGVFVGEKTWGATGPITAENVYNSGQFNVGDFMTIQASSAQFKYLDGTIYEGEGIQPDIIVPFNKSLLDAGVDLQLEKAISLIK